MVLAFTLIQRPVMFSYKVGQYTSMADSESVPVDNLLFAGEHCSYRFRVL